MNVTRWYFPVGNGAPHIMSKGILSEPQMTGSLDYVNGLRDRGSRVEFFTLPDETDVIAVYDPRGNIWETWMIEPASV